MPRPAAEHPAAAAAPSSGAAAFHGFPPEAVTFYQRLEVENTKEFWVAHKAEWERVVRDPMAALLDALEPEFGPAKAFRPYRDVRFSKDKSPYKTHHGAFAEAAPSPSGGASGIGYYVEISGRGLLAGGGFHVHSPEQTARLRAAVDAPPTGIELQEIMAALAGGGFEVAGEQLKTAPRGFAKDHPRIELLRRKEIMAFQRYGEPDWLGTTRALDEVANAWRGIQPLARWVATNVGST